MRVVYTPRYHLDLGAHVFPTARYAAVAERVRALGLVPRGFVEPAEAAWEDLALVHSAEYIGALRSSTLTPDDVARLEIPCTPSLVEGFRLMTGGTLLATVLALDGEDRTAVHIGGGFHHAFAGHGEGFCVFNDIAVGIRVAFARRLAGSAAVLDLDVHHGNGTASIFTGDSRVFTASMHEEDNYPFVKPRGSLDIGLARGTSDDEYLARLAEVLARTFEHLPDVLFYVAGADPFCDDQLGRLALTKFGLRQRDRMVFAAARAAGMAIVVVLAGGYARHLDDTVDIHVATIEEARAAEFGAA